MLSQTEYRQELFKGLSPAQRLVWFYIAHQGEGEYSARSLAKELGIAPHTANTAVAELRRRQLLAEVLPASGRRPARLRAVQK